MVGDRTELTLFGLLEFRPRMGCAYDRVDLIFLPGRSYLFKIECNANLGKVVFFTICSTTIKHFLKV